MIQFRVVRVLVPMTAVIVQEAEYTLSRSPVSMCQRQTTIPTHIHHEVMQKFGLTEEATRHKVRWRQMIHCRNPQREQQKE